ncbi:MULTISPECIES: chemotaxis protein CheA [unclassified Halomonas]|uniref:chemotaxis protein CheA n=1 Tax=unclassified Halomonas TaxID=2609666 RepID=UPI001C95AF83|nr:MULTISPECIES: chemotaxis protein CheA [unclassified Halomonas]MBY5924944.1 chemotaxis protein CheA [Halomonas sp. DP4Y7-2]MBY6231985.1 chemotaxis protein CheA [Halomonas sp. DP4Y7-1]
MDITDFYDTFFEEAEELLADMERHLLELDPAAPDTEQLNAIFRAAHSIKGGAGTFGFDVLQRTTHLFENLLDHTRRGELRLRPDIVDIFLETKDMLNDQLDAYRNEQAPDQEAYERICQTLKTLALEEIGQSLDGGHEAAPAPTPATPPQPETAPAEESPTLPSAGDRLLVALIGVGDKDRELLVEELAQLGEVVEQRGDAERYEVVLSTSVSAEDIEAVMCFIAEPEQVAISTAASSNAAADVHAQATGSEPEASSQGPASTDSPSTSQPDSTPSATTPPASTPSASAPPAKAAAGAERKTSAKPAKENSSIRVSVDKVDQIINLVGELIITQSMLDQTVSELDGAADPRLLNGMNLLQRNARDLQEAVMSVRMVPMDYVFSRYPRLVRDLAGKLDKEVELTTEGESTELDKSLTERIIDPLTHLVRNSLDHGIESPQTRLAAGKPATGRLTLSAQHQGGNILIEVIDDGAGLDRERILAKARDSGLSVSDSMSDDEVWQLIFAPGFSTAAQVSDVSGRGVGMDVVKRNIQAMGGHVEILSRQGQGTTTRIVLPLTLAILDGMSIRVGDETFILPLSAVLESLQPSREHLYSMAGDDQVLQVRDEYLPVVAVHEALDVANARTEITETIAVIVQGEGRRYALLVDDLIGQQQVVVKNLETNYRRVPGVSAATILGDGSVALILDIADLHRLHREKRQRKPRELASQTASHSLTEDLSA